MKILLVEDHAVVAEMSALLLREEYGHEVRQAPSGAEAIRAAKEFLPDLMLIDLNLPDIDGYELAKRLRRDPDFAKTLLVALTGWGNLVESGRAREAGFDAHFQKPMDFALLTELTRLRSSAAR